MLCADATMFKHTGRLNASTGYAGIESMSVPLNSTEDNLDWDQFHEAMDWIKPKILDVQAFFFNSASCWEKLGCLLTHGCEILRLGPSGYPNLLSTGSRNAITRWPYVGGVKDAITPFNLSTVTSLQLLVLQKASNIHHISITFPPGLLLPIHPHDAEISLIHHLRMSNLTSLCLIREVRPFFEEDPEDVFNGWASYWAKEEVWSKVAEGGDAVKIDRLTSQHQDSQCESICHVLHLFLMF